MKAVVIYESLTGNTKKVAETLAAELSRRGATATAYRLGEVDLQALAEADVVAVGTWTDGFLLFGQRPASAGKFEKMPAMAGKKAVVFVTYAHNPKKVAEQLTKIVERRGATVVGTMTIRRSDLEGGATEMAERLIEASGLTAA